MSVKAGHVLISRSALRARPGREGRKARKTYSHIMHMKTVSLGSMGVVLDGDTHGSSPLGSPCTISLFRTENGAVVSSNKFDITEAMNKIEEVRKSDEKDREMLLQFNQASNSFPNSENNSEILGKNSPQPFGVRDGTERP